MGSPFSKQQEVNHGESPEELKQKNAILKEKLAIAEGQIEKSEISKKNRVPLDRPWKEVTDDVFSEEEIVLRNRHSLESIEVTRGNTATHPLTTSSTANSAKRRPTAPTFTTHRLYAYFPSNRINRGLFLMAVSTRTIFPGYKWWRYPKGKFTRGCSIYFVAVGSWTQQPASSPTFPYIPRHSEQHPDQRINGGQTTPASRRRPSIN
uniref:Uncharacterized protein LOC111109495 isoform X3 n=1 Tax=Crassostrea virginica TaxID=6565 RepID=A0A8B8BD62_CRAVI|nr:uncharacterized protein LOC111109495 isoform X3 [Crassostrea virginica]